MKIVGQVTKEEVEEIKILYEKEVALKNLLVLKLSEKIKIDIENDLEKIQSLMEKWWKEKSQKYKWEGADKNRWEVAFSDGKITLVEYE